MTELRLLEMAAKAAGLELWMDEYDNLYLPDPMRRWNPLEDDGDALRLAGMLHLIVAAYGNYASVGETYDKPKLDTDGAEFICWHHETSGDQQAAMRRAIVRAAAAIQQAREAK